MNKLIPLNFPPYKFKLQSSKNGLYIFDEFRKKHIKLNPEEWVRQHSLQYLVKEKKIPLSFIAVEKQIIVNHQIFRFDGLAYDKLGNALVLIECKASNIPLNQLVADQIFSYNSQVKAPYIFITNGLQHLFFEYFESENKIQRLKELPEFEKYYL